MQEWSYCGKRMKGDESDMKIDEGHRRLWLQRESSSKIKSEERPYLALENVDLAVLDVHVILDLGQLGIHAIALLLRLHRRLRLLLNHPVLLLEPLSHLFDLRNEHIFKFPGVWRMVCQGPGTRRKVFRRVQSGIFNAQYVRRKYTRRRDAKRRDVEIEGGETRREKLDPVFRDGLAFLSPMVASPVHAICCSFNLTSDSVRPICQTADRNHVPIISFRKFFFGLERFFQRLRMFFFFLSFPKNLSCGINRKRFS